MRPSTGEKKFFYNLFRGNQPLSCLTLTNVNPMLYSYSNSLHQNWDVSLKSMLLFVLNPPSGNIFSIPRAPKRIILGGLHREI